MNMPHLQRHNTGRQDKQGQQQAQDEQMHTSIGKRKFVQENASPYDAT
jgi:hypothetical protein